MTEHFNKKEMQKRRRQLRANMTYCEKLVWLYLRKRQMKERFLRQYSVDNYVVDFYCPKLKLAIEVDGDIHDLQDQKKYDKDRQEYLENFGIQFVRVKNVKLLSNPDKEFQRIENEIQKLGNTKDVNKFLAP
ncbi:MAG: endonuclease domain-containing protein [Bacteroidota bacterium]